MSILDATPAGKAARVGKHIAVGLTALIVAALVFGALFWIGARLFPRHDPTPARAAHKDTVVARDTAQTIGARTEERTRDASVHVDITTKEIRDAFDQLPPAPPAPVAGAPAPDLPAAPVDRLRERLNEGIARANRAAGAADPGK